MATASLPSQARRDEVLALRAKKQENQISSEAAAGGPWFGRET